MFTRRLHESPIPTWTAMSEPKSSSPSEIDQVGESQEEEEDEDILHQRKRKSKSNGSSSLRREVLAKRPKLADSGRSDTSAGPSKPRRASKHDSSQIPPAIRPSGSSSPRIAVTKPFKPSSSTSMSSQRANVFSENAVSSPDTDSLSTSVPRFVPKQVARKTTGPKPAFKSHTSTVRERDHSEMSRASSSRSDNSRPPSHTKLVKRTKEEKHKRRKSGLESGSDDDDEVFVRGEAPNAGGTGDKKNRGKIFKQKKTRSGRASTSNLASSISSPASPTRNRRRSLAGYDDIALSSESDAVIIGGRLATNPKPNVARKPNLISETIIISDDDDLEPLPAPRLPPKRDKSKHTGLSHPAPGTSVEVIEIFDSDEDLPPVRETQSKGKEKEDLVNNADDENEWDMNPDVDMNDYSIPSPPPAPSARTSADSTSRQIASLDQNNETPPLAETSGVNVKEEGKKEKKADRGSSESESRGVRSSVSDRIRALERLPDSQVGNSEGRNKHKKKKHKKKRASDDSVSTSQRNSPPPKLPVSGPPSQPIIPAVALPHSTPVQTPPSPSTPVRTLSAVVDAPLSPAEQPAERNSHDTDASESYDLQLAFGEQMAQAFQTSGVANSRKPSSTDDARTTTPLTGSSYRSARKRPSNFRYNFTAKGKNRVLSSSDSDVDMDQSRLPLSGSPHTNVAGSSCDSDSDRADGESAGVRIPPPTKPSSSSRVAASQNPLTSPRFGNRRPSNTKPISATLVQSMKQSETPTKPFLTSSESQPYSPALYPRVDFRSSNSRRASKDRRRSAGLVKDQSGLESPATSLRSDNGAAVDKGNASPTPDSPSRMQSEAPIRIPKPAPRKSSGRANESDVAQAIEAASKHNDNLTVKATGKNNDPIDLTLEQTDDDEEPMANADAVAQVLREYFNSAEKLSPPASTAQDERVHDSVQNGEDVTLGGVISHWRESADELNIRSSLEHSIHEDENPEPPLLTPRSSPQRPTSGNKQPSGDSTTLESQVDDLSKEMSTLLEEPSALSNGKSTSSTPAEKSRNVTVVEELFPELEYVDWPSGEDNAPPRPVTVASGVASRGHSGDAGPVRVDDFGVSGSKSAETSSSGSDSEMVIQALRIHSPDEMAEDSSHPAFPIVAHEPELQVPITEEELTGRSPRSRSHSSSSPPIRLRRSRRVRSTSTGYDEGSLDSPFVTPPRSPTPDDRLSSPKLYSGSGVLTWEHYRRELRNTTPEYRLARDLPHKMHDYINAMEQFTRDYPQMQELFEAMMLENTADDEPDAPHITVRNNCDDMESTPPWEFYYTNRMWLGKNVPLPSRKNLVSCDCVGRCDPKSKKCACLRRQENVTGGYQQGFLYDSQGFLKQAGLPIYECNSLCNCSEECKNRVVGNGRKHEVRIEKTKDKGWGVFAGSRKIPRGSFIGIYAGELIVEEEAEERGTKYNKFGRTYLFDVDFYHIKEELGREQDASSKYCVDAYHAGNFTRFLNHSCDPNCLLTPVYIDEDDIEKPLLTIFARRDISPNEEITFSYRGDPENDEGDEANDQRPSLPSSPAKPHQGKGANVYARCRCGAWNCKGEIFL